MTRVQRAFTLIELVVSMAIIAIVVSLLLVGIGAAREAARRVHCQNNLRQLGIALNQYIDRSGGRLPKQSGGERPRAGPWYHMAAQLELQSNADSVVNINGFVANERQLVGLMMCPSDGEVGCNYRACGTSGYCYFSKSDFWPRPTDTADGLIPSFRVKRRISDVTDGISHTAFASERLIANGLGEPGREVAHQTGIFPTSISPSPPHDELVDFLQDNWPLWQKSSEIGKMWYGKGFGQTAYNHVSAPNHPIAAVFHGDEIEDSGMGVMPPTSHHPGGVNLCRADGSVEFVNDGIDRDVWIALATISGSD